MPATQVEPNRLASFEFDVTQYARCYCDLLCGFTRRSDRLDFESLAQFEHDFVTNELGPFTLVLQLFILLLQLSMLLLQQGVLLLNTLI